MKKRLTLFLGESPPEADRLNRGEKAVKCGFLPDYK